MRAHPLRRQAQIDRGPFPRFFEYVRAKRAPLPTKRLPKQRAERIEKSRVPPRRRKDGAPFIVSSPRETLRRAGDRAA